MKEWIDLTNNQKNQARKTYAAIRAVEEEIDESMVDTSGVVDCSFEIDEYGYVHVII